MKEDITGAVYGAIEAILFVCGEPVESRRLADTLGTTETALEDAVSAMNESYEKNRRGFLLKKIENRYQMVTNPIYGEQVKKCLNLDESRPLSQTLLETLSIIAYMQPVTKQQITDIRGADANHAVNKLTEKGLVCERGRLDVPGRPILFGTTDGFLRNFGFESVKDMQKILDESGKIDDNV